ncbi:MAG: hypothetical protein JW982_12230 [Spirochaetes bacterium]|nr:hypothetical protein [Spirochaetota bacterium]
MFENTKYSLINRILAFMSFPELLTGIDEKTVLSLFFIWIIPPLNACYILFFSGKAAIEMEYLYNECGISLFKKLIFKFTPDYFFRLSCLAAADILFYIILTFGSLNSN